MRGARNTASLLETGEQLPFHQIAALALREGRRPRAIYTLPHKWFARRLGTVLRALLVGAVAGPEDNFWEAYYGGVDLRGLTVLDPFVGGGTSVVEGEPTWGQYSCSRRGSHRVLGDEHRARGGEPPRSRRRAEGVAGSDRKAAAPVSHVRGRRRHGVPPSYTTSGFKLSRAWPAGSSLMLTPTSYWPTSLASSGFSAQRAATSNRATRSTGPSHADLAATARRLASGA